MSTFPSDRKGSRFLDTDSVKSILLSSPRTALATILAISTSKPSCLLVAGLRRPKRGWSYLVPTTMRPRSWIRLSVPGFGLMVGEALALGDAEAEALGLGLPVAAGEAVVAGFAVVV